jgi:DMSO/TMAO reductase YedYZ molybdopterin-dependent catalytic subunit
MHPPGQIPRSDFPRFGLPQYADRYPSHPTDRAVSVKTPLADSIVLHDPLSGLPRRELTADFHCVTTWSRLDLTWGGVRFSDFFHYRVAPLAALPVPALPAPILGVILRGQDGYRTTLPLEDLLAEDVLLADELNGEPLTFEHGAPLRLVAPKHYGYKSMKHLAKLEFCQSEPVIKHGPLAFLDHPRARVALEERGRFFPGWLLRRLYRPFIPSTVERFRIGTIKYNRSVGESR